MSLKTGLHKDVRLAVNGAPPTGDSARRYRSRAHSISGTSTTTSATAPSRPCAARRRFRSGPRSKCDGFTGRRRALGADQARRRLLRQPSSGHFQLRVPTSPSTTRHPEVAEYFGSMIVLDDPRHQRLRSIVSRAFTPKVVARIETSVRERAHRLVAVDDRQSSRRARPIWSASSPGRCRCRSSAT